MGQREKEVEVVCPREGEEGGEEFPVQRAQGTMTGYSVSEVAHGELVNIRDRPELVELGAWGK